MPVVILLVFARVEDDDSFASLNFEERVAPSAENERSTSSGESLQLYS